VAGTFTAVDLSRLPKPDVIEQLDFETIFGRLRDKLVELYPAFTALLESDPGTKILQAAAYEILLVRQRVNDAAHGVMLAYAVKGDLDNIGAPYGVARLLVSPADPLNGIAAVYESDADFRRRIQLSLDGFSTAGPEGAYVFHSLSADGKVLDASATSPAPAEVVVTVLSRDGDGTAPQPLLDAVNARVNADDVRPLTDFVTVQSAAIVPYQITATIYTYAGPDADVVIASARARAQAYATAMHKLGLDVTLSGLYAALHEEGVQRVDLVAPVANIVVDRTQATYCTAINLTNGGTDE